MKVLTQITTFKLRNYVYELTISILNQTDKEIVIRDIKGQLIYSDCRLLNSTNYKTQKGIEVFNQIKKEIINSQFKTIGKQLCLFK